MFLGIFLMLSSLKEIDCIKESPDLKNWKLVVLFGGKDGKREAPTVQSLALCVHSSVYLQKKWQDIFIFFVSIPGFYKSVCLFFSPDSTQPEVRFSCCIGKGSNDVFCVFSC